MTSTFYFAVNISSPNLQKTALKSTTSPFFTSNQALMNTCPANYFAYLSDPSIQGSSQSGCSSGCCGNGQCGGQCCSNCCGSGCPSSTSCWGFTQCNPGCTLAGSHWIPTYNVNYNCYQPNPAYFLPYTNGSPNPPYESLNYISLYPSVNNPSVVLYSVVYNNSVIQTPAQIQALITCFGSSNVYVSLATTATGVNYGHLNDETLNSLLTAVCQNNPSYLFTTPCSSFCSSTPNTPVSGTTLSSGNPPTNCQSAWTSYCNSSSNFTTSPCLGWYQSQLTTQGNTQTLPASSPAYNILTTNCNNPEFFKPPPQNNPNGAYTISPNAPPICGCFYPSEVSTSWYTNLAYTYPGLVLSDTSIPCNYPPCANSVSLNYYNTNPSCPTENTVVMNCINSATIINSTTGDIEQTNQCEVAQNVTSSTTYTSDVPQTTTPVPSLSPSPPTIHSFHSTSPPSSSSIPSSSSMSLTTKLLLIGLPIFITALSLTFLLNQKSSNKEETNRHTLS